MAKMQLLQSLIEVDIIFMEQRRLVAVMHMVITLIVVQTAFRALHKSFQDFIYYVCTLKSYCLNSMNCFAVGNPCNFYTHHEYF